MEFLYLVSAAAAALGLREIIPMIFGQVFGRRKSKAEIDGLHLSNDAQGLSNFQEAVRCIGELRREMEADKRVIQELKNSKIEDDRRIARRDGIIEEQRSDIKVLHEQVAELRIKHRELEIRVAALESENKELVKENAQLRGMHVQAADSDDDRR